MKNLLKIGLLTLTSLVYGFTVQAQRIDGYVYELTSSNPIWNATIQNLRTKESVQTDRYGKFQIAGQVNDYLTISTAGYKQDTVFHFEDGVKRIYMLRDEGVLAIDEVLVKRLTDSRLAAEIDKAKKEGKAVDANQHQGGLRISPSRLFGKQAKAARQNLGLLVAEQEARQVDRIFSAQLIASITPLNPDEIALFRERFRPSLSFVKQANAEQLKVYILDAYKKFKTD